MFGLFKSQPTPDHLATAKQKLRDLVSIHLRTLATKRHAGITIDAYGTPDGSKWIAETQYFVDNVWLPLLTNQEKRTVVEAGLSAIGQELIESVARAECTRIHLAGECDMTVATHHPPDAPATHSKATARPSRATRPASTGVGISRGLIIREEPLE